MFIKELQKAIIARIRGIAETKGRCYKVVPDKAELPYVVIIDVLAEEEGSFGRRNSECEVTICVCDRGTNVEDGIDVADAVYDALHNGHKDLQSSKVNFLSCRQERAREITGNDPKVQTIEMIFTIWVEEK